MGFFSWNCQSCGKSIRSEWSVTPKTEWMSIAVAIVPTGMYMGKYDGYGRIESIDIASEQPTMYHRACWRDEGMPQKYLGESDWAPDQGFFLDKSKP